MAVVHHVQTHVFIAILAEFLFVVFGAFGQISYSQFQALSLFDEIDAPVLKIVHCPVHEEAQQFGLRIFSRRNGMECVEVALDGGVVGIWCEGILTFRP